MTKEEITCKTCNGKGFTDRVKNGNSTPCPECHGAGKFTKVETKRGGIK